MTTTYVLIVIAYVYGGIHVSFQEFTSDLRCDQARLVVEQSKGRLQSATCVKK